MKHRIRSKKAVQLFCERSIVRQSSFRKTWSKISIRNDVITALLHVTSSPGSLNDRAAGKTSWNNSRLWSWILLSLSNEIWFFPRIAISSRPFFKIASPVSYGRDAPDKISGGVLVWKRVYTLPLSRSGIGYGFRGNYGCLWTYLSFQFQMSKKEREICEFD